MEVRSLVWGGYQMISRARSSTGVVGADRSPSLRLKMAAATAVIARTTPASALFSTAVAAELTRTVATQNSAAASRSIESVRTG